MRIAIATTGRFHVLDLARELAALGHEVAFYSFVPKRRAMRFGLPAKCHRPLLAQAAPWLAMQRLAPACQRKRWDRRLLERMDHLIARRLAPCDVFIGMSGLCVESARAAKEKYGARVFIERGSRHILSQKQILDEIADRVTSADRVSPFAVRRELASYELADVVVVPSHHAEKSFIEEGFSADKLFRNAYGVDLTMFEPTQVPPVKPPTILFVGGWCLRKGCDVLVEAWAGMDGVRLMHVGAIGDAPLPNGALFVHHDPVPQWRLKEFYGQASIFVLASREDGFGLVLVQALACGLPVVCTDRTGGEDLREFLEDPRWIIVVPHDDAGALREGIGEALRLAASQFGTRKILEEESMGKLSWRAYGLRYQEKLFSIAQT
jgi:glycosyltransferase involved in cell wall biosynthesis